MKKIKSVSLYWKCQITGWSVAALYWGFLGLSGAGFDVGLAIIQFITDVLIYIVITHFFRLISKKYSWHRLSFPELLIRLIPAIFTLGLSYTAVTIVKLHIINTLFLQDPGPFWEFYRFNRLPVFIAGVRLMSIWVLAYYLYHYAQREMNIIKENARLSLIAKEAQLANLVSQLNPHFLFNSLNNIKSLVIESPGAARRAIDLLSDLLRTSLYGRDTMFITIKEEVSVVNDYLELEKLRFEERLQFTIDVDDRLLPALIIPFSLLTMVENAIKHGINKLRDGGIIKIKIERKESAINMSVASPGKLADSGRGTGLGLKNLQERLHLQFTNAQFSIAQQENETVLASILIPAA